MTLCTGIFFQELSLITPWPSLCDWIARQPWCHRLDSAQRRLCTAGRVISLVARPNHSMFSAFGRWGWVPKADSRVCLPVSSDRFCFCVYASIDEKSHSQQVACVFSPVKLNHLCPRQQWGREPTRQPSLRGRQEKLYVFAIWYQKHRSRKSFCTHCTSLRVLATVMSSNKDFSGFSIAHGTLKRRHWRANLVTVRTIRFPVSRQARSEGDMETLDFWISQGWAHGNRAQHSNRWMAQTSYNWGFHHLQCLWAGVEG